MIAPIRNAVLKRCSETLNYASTRTSCNLHISNILSDRCSACPVRSLASLPTHLATGELYYTNVQLANNLRIALSLHHRYHNAGPQHALLFAPVAMGDQGVKTSCFLSSRMTLLAHFSMPCSRSHFPPILSQAYFPSMY